MPEDDWLVDDITARIVRTLIENPTISYNKSQLIEAADVSRTAFYNRFNQLKDRDIIETAHVASGHKYWKLNPDSDAADALSVLLYPEGERQ